VIDETDVHSLYESWRDSEKGQEAWSRARALASHRAAIREILSSFKDWLEESGRGPMEEDEDASVWMTICDEVYA
jgi:hypothetical protein